MKVAAYFILVSLVLLVGGCSSVPEKPAERFPETVMIETNKRAEETNIKENVRLENIRQRYAEEYDLQYCFEDIYVPHKCWMIGETCVMQLVTFADMDELVIMMRDSIDHVKVCSFEQFVSVELYDSTGKTISILVSSPDAEAILAELQ